MTGRDHCLVILADDCGEKWTYIGPDMGSLMEYMEEIREGEFNGEATFTSLADIDFPDIFIEVLEVSNIPKWWYVLREQSILDDAVLASRVEAVTDPKSFVQRDRAGFMMFDVMVRIGIDLGLDAASYDLTLLHFIDNEQTMQYVKAECEFIVKTSMTLGDMHKAAVRKLEIIT